jgi:hypothetical protein
MLPTDVKIALVNYKHYHDSIETINGQIECVNADRFRVGGSIIKIPENPKPRDVIIIENLERLEKLRKSLSLNQYLAELSDAFIEALPEPFNCMVEDKYIHKLTAYELEGKYCYSFRQINRIIDKLIEKFVEWA